jgi:proteasome lid subunit RPN8/RPN11
VEAIELGDGVRREIIDHARAEAPKECCGLLIGRGHLIDEAVRSRNLDARPGTRFEVDPRVHVAAIRRLRGTDRSVIGCYHSHPSSPPVPSESDIAEAWYPDFLWIIVSLQSPQPELAGYRIADNRYERVALIETSRSLN